MLKRYSILNKHIQGSNAIPQTAHGLNNLWVKYSSGKMSDNAAALFKEWSESEHGQVEIVLRGGSHRSLTDLYDALVKVTNVPCSKFNETEDDLCGACTVVSFVATDRIVCAGNYVRANRLNPYNVEEWLKNAVINDSEGNEFKLTDDEIFIVSNIAFLGLV